MNIMALGIILKNLFVWMYFIAPLQFLKIWSNFVWFLYNFFSIRLLAGTLFSKWRRIGETQRKRGFEELFSAFVINSLMRIVGFIVRTFVIIAGLATISLSILLGVILFISWFFLPLLIIIMFATGIRFLII